MGRHGIASSVAALVAAAWALQTPASAQDQAPPRWRQEGPGKTVIEAAHGLSWTERDVTITFLTGGVTVQQATTTIHATRAMMWKAKDSTKSFDEIYAEGNVIFTREAQKLSCERFFYSMVADDGQGAGAVVDVRLAGFSKDLRTDFFAMAKQARIRGRDGQMVADDVRLTSCSYGAPHYHLSVDHATLFGSDRRVKSDKDKFDPWPFQDWVFDFDQIVPEFSGLPFLYIPGLSVGPWLMNFPIRTVRYGHSNRYGNFVYTDFGSRIRLKDEAGKPRTWGDVDLKFDWRQIRGFAGGLDLDYKWAGYNGYLETYYLHDNGRRTGSEFDAQFPPLVRPERGRAHWFHRQDFLDHWRYELEVNYLSDRHLLQEFFPSEFQSAKEPETAAYLRWMEGNMGAFLLGRYRLNDFQTFDQYAPRADFNLLSEPILGGLLDNVYLTERFDAVDIRRKFDEDLNLRSVETWRVDSVTELFMPFEFRYFQVSPFVQNRFTFYEEDLAGDTRGREIGTAGARVTAQLHTTRPDWKWERIGIRGFRHVVELETRYTNNFASNVDPGDLFPYEPVDQLGRFEEVAFEVRQRFLTKDSANQPFEFLNLTLGIEYYPEFTRDTVRPDPTNFTPPFNWIPVTPNSSGVFARRGWSNFNYEFSFHPRDFIAISGAGEYNFQSHSEEAREIAVTLSPASQFTMSVSQVLVKGVTNAFTLGTTWALTPKWAVSVAGQYDFRNGEYLRQNLVIARDFHDFSIEAVVERDFSRNDNRVFVAFVPKFLGKAGLRRSHLYAPGARVEDPADR